MLFAIFAITLATTLLPEPLAHIPLTTGMGGKLVEAERKDSACRLLAREAVHLSDDQKRLEQLRSGASDAETSLIGIMSDHGKRHINWSDITANKDSDDFQRAVDEQLKDLKGRYIMISVFVTANCPL